MSEKIIFDSGYNAIGKPISANRLNNAYKTVKEMIPDITTEKAMLIIGKAASHLEQDNPYNLIGAVSSLEPELNLLDLSGRYRLMSVLLND